MEFINIRQGGMSVHEYSFKFTKLSKYSPSLVFDPRDERIRFVTGVIGWFLRKVLFSYAKWQNEHFPSYGTCPTCTRANRKSRNAKRARSFYGGSSKNRLEIEDKPRFKKLVSNQVPSNLPKARGDKVANQILKREELLVPTKKSKSNCGEYGKKQYGDCLVRTDKCFSCGKIVTRLGISLMCIVKWISSKRFKWSSKEEPFYALLSRGKQETSPNVVTNILKLLFINVYVSLDPSATLSFVTPLVAKKFDILPDILHDPFIVSTPVGESVVAKRVIEIFL